MRNPNWLCFAILALAPGLTGGAAADAVVAEGVVNAPVRAV